MVGLIFTLGRQGAALSFATQHVMSRILSLHYVLFGDLANVAQFKLRNFTAIVLGIISLEKIFTIQFYITIINILTNHFIVMHHPHIASK